MRNRLKVILTLLGLLPFSVNIAQEPLRINNPFNYPESEFISSIWEEVARRNKVAIKIQQMPNKRSLINANSGIDDADTARIFNISKYYPNLVSVPEIIYKMKIIALSKKEGLAIKTLNDLKPYHVGLIRGMKITDLKMSEVKPRSIIQATDYKTLLKLLNKGRIDIAFIDKVGILNEISKKRTHNHYYIYTPPLISVDLYMQLNKKHQQYVEPFQKTLKAIKQDGTYDKLFKRHVNINVLDKVDYL